MHQPNTVLLGGEGQEGGRNAVMLLSLNCTL
jgi:hypothetical protein